MKEILSFAFDKLTDPLSLPLELYQEWIILGVIELIAFVIARRITGRLYDGGSIYGHAAGSLCNWIIRFIIFVGIWAITNLTIRIVRFIIAHWIICIIAFVGMLGFAGVICSISYRNRAANAHPINTGQQEIPQDNVRDKSGKVAD